MPEGSRPRECLFPFHPPSPAPEAVILICINKEIRKLNLMIQETNWHTDLE